MPARLRVFLNREEDRTLLELRTAITVSQKVKDRAEVVRLNSRGWYVEKIAVHFNWAEQTVRPGFLTKKEKKGVKNCENVYVESI
ncbi:MAG: helix-turn-helix domain-containing protein [Dolichospermum sp. WA123]|nr:helix-turn-helix domain-containing protein [Dolichospermum sp. WA123]